MITIIIKNHKPIAYAKNEYEAKKKIMEKLEKNPSYYDWDVEKWWERTGWNVKDVYSFKHLSDEI